MSKSNDLLGLMFSTATVPIDDDPGFDGKGYTALITPENNNPADPDEDDAAYEGLRRSGLSPEEAQENVDFMKPISDEERAILAETPLLDGLTRVDDAEHDQWLGQKATEGHNAIDRALEDAVYGDDPMAHDEERMERNDTDSGWGFRSAFRKVGRGIKKAGRGVGRGIRKGIRTPFGAIARFIPGRDARKARLLKNVFRKLWYEHANWLAKQDKAAGLPLKPRTDYEYVSKLWAKEEMRKNKLPTNFAVSGADILGAQILGAENMGSWYWPFGNFLNFSRTTIQNTSDKRDGTPPDEHSDAEKPEFEPVGEPSASETAPSPSADDQQGDPSMHGWNGIRNLKGNHDILGASDLDGEDSLGAYAIQILGGSPQPARDNPHVDKIIAAIAMKLKAGKPISPSELGLLSSAAKEGNVKAQKILVVLEARGVAVSGDESGMDPWMYKLNPTYWIASKRKKALIDIEKKNWVENADLQKKLAKQKEVLDEAERAAQATRAVAEAKAQSAATEAQLREIESSLKGAMSGSFVGHEKIMPISDVVVRALEKTGKKDRAGKLYAKIKTGQPLDAGELKEARQIANLIGRMKVVHGDLVSESEETLAMHGAFIGACVMGGIGAAQERNAKQSQFADAMGKKIASGQALTTAERNGLARVLGDQAKLHEFTASLVSGAAFVGCPQGKTWTRGAFVGAMKAMSEQDKKALSSIVKFAKLGNPRAQRALVYLKKSGEIAGGDCIGESRLQKAFNYAAAPIALSGDESGWWGKKKKHSANDVRLAKMRAAAKRAKAAKAKAAAADAETEAEQRAQQAIADAADAEADAADAEAMAKEQQMKTAEAEANPDSIPTSAGEFIGGWTDMIGKGTKAHRIVQKASEQSATGTKIRAGATLYTQAKKGDPKARRAIKVMVVKAKKGDPQAIRDINAVKAGRVAVRAKARAERKQIAMQKWTARRARVVAAQRGFEARAANQLARMSRKHELKKLAKVERKAAKGDPKAKAFVAKKVAASKRGDRKAMAQVRGMQLGRAVRIQVTSKQEAKRMKAATKMAKRLQRNDPRAIRQCRIIQTAASHGNPNAQRAMKRLALGGAMVATIATGTVVLPKLAGKPKPVKRLKRGTLGYVKAQRKIALLRRKINAGTATPAEIGYGANLALQMGDEPTATFLANLNDKTLQAARQQVADAKTKAATGTGTREELTCGAKKANQIGDQESTGQLTQAASKAPSATEALKKQANEVAAAQSGNPAAQASLDKTLADAKSGDVKAIDKLGTIQAVKTLDDINKGKPISPTMADALNTHAQAQAGDVPAQEMLQKISENATKPNPAPEAVLAASGAVAASKLSAALANKPQARQQLAEKANPPIPAAEKGSAQAEVAEILAKANEGTATPEEGQRGAELAQRLGKPKLAAEIRAKAPPYEAPPSTAMSSLPDEPLPPIQGARQLIKESLKAVTLTTRDPLANYREGVTARSKGAVAATPSADVTSSGWSPFKAYRVAKKIAPFTPFAAPFAAASAIADASRKKGAPAPEPAPAPTAETPTATATAGSFVGSSDNYKDLIANALQSKKMSKADFNKAVDASAGPNAAPFAKKALAEQTLKFLKEKNVTVGGDFVGASDAELEKLMSQAITDDQLDRFMTNAMKSDHRIKLSKLLRKRPDLRERVGQRAAEGHLVAAEIMKATLLLNKAEAGDPAAKKAYVNWCSTPPHSSSGHMTPGHNYNPHNYNPHRVKGDSLGDFVGTFVGKSDEFKQLIIAALKTKKMSKDDFNKAVTAHVKPGASQAEKTAAGEKMLKFLASKNVKVG